MATQSRQGVGCHINGLVQDCSISSVLAMEYCTKPLICQYKLLWVYPETIDQVRDELNSVVSCQKGPTHHAYAWPLGSFWQDTLKLY